MLENDLKEELTKNPLQNFDFMNVSTNMFAFNIIEMKMGNVYFLDFFLMFLVAIFQVKERGEFILNSKTSILNEILDFIFREIIKIECVFNYKNILVTFHFLTEVIKQNQKYAEYIKMQISRSFQKFY